MKKLVNVVEVQGEGMEALLGDRVCFFCLNYIYFGELIGVNTHDVLLKNAFIVYETGDFNATGFKDAQPLGPEWRLRTATIESYGVFTNKK